MKMHDTLKTSICWILSGIILLSACGCAYDIGVGPELSQINSDQNSNSSNETFFESALTTDNPVSTQDGDASSPDSGAAVTTDEAITTSILDLIPPLPPYYNPTQIVLTEEEEEIYDGLVNDKYIGALSKKISSGMFNADFDELPEYGTGFIGSQSRKMFDIIEPYPNVPAYIGSWYKIMPFKKIIQYNEDLISVVQKLKYEDYSYYAYMIFKRHFKEYQVYDTQTKTYIGTGEYYEVWWYLGECYFFFDIYPSTEFSYLVPGYQLTEEDYLKFPFHRARSYAPNPDRIMQFYEVILCTDGILITVFDETNGHENYLDKKHLKVATTRFYPYGVDWDDVVYSSFMVEKIKPYLPVFGS
ncbi:MAG: hypothetical protein MJ137_02575 [Clostridia bacterium]|nr:hypothetical protein [Clostridia bacterium]